MTTYTASNGQTFNDDDISRWAHEAENGFPNSDLIPGTPKWKTSPLHTRTFRTTDEFWKTVQTLAHKKNMTTTQFTREALAEHIARNAA